MFYINDDYYTAEYLAQKHNEFERSGTVHTQSRLAVCLDEPAEWLALCLFIKQKNASVLPIHPSTPLEAAKRMASRAGCEQLLFKNLTDAISLDQDAVQSPARPGEGCLIQMSSGTTGEPKCIDRSWKSIDAEIQSYCSAFTQANDMRPLIACPVTHSYGLICGVLVAFYRGLEPRVITNINPRYLVKQVLNSTRPLLYSSPAMLQGLIRLLPEGQNIYAAMSSGTLLSRQQFEGMAPRIDHFFQQYGCSEAGCIAVNPNLRSAGDVGIPLPHLSVCAGENAENPAEITVTTTDGRQIHTKDLGYLQHDTATDTQMLCFLSRMDDTIIVAGLNVYPQEVEDVVLEMPGITDAVVYKIEDPYAGQRVALAYSAENQVAGTEIRQWCTTRLAPHQLPQQLVQTDSIERMPNGKINRKQLALTLARKASTDTAAISATAAIQ